jgi:hypothetical protein
MFTQRLQDLLSPYAGHHSAATEMKSPPSTSVLTATRTDGRWRMSVSNVAGKLLLLAPAPLVHSPLLTRAFRPFNSHVDPGDDVGWAAARAGGCENLGADQFRPGRDR